VAVVTKARLWLVGLVAVAASCQGLADRGTRGPALLTIRGQITLAPGTSVDGKLRLALAWYPGLYGGGVAVEGCDEAPFLGLVSQDVEYEPTFPADYAFDLTAPPPAAAQRVVPDVPGASGAIGSIVAYVDGNGNGKLDPCRRGQPCADRVLGASGSFVAGDSVDNRFIAYATAAASAGDGGATVGPGFFLVRAATSDAEEPTYLPLPQTRVDLTLDARATVQAIICSELCDRFVLGVCRTEDLVCDAPAALARATCAAPFPGDLGPSRDLVWIDVENCTITRNSYAVEGSRDLPPWWPCK
jgi:hypothetical protein